MWTPSTFTLFSGLPPEIQNMIWQTAIDSVRPRVVEVTERIALKSKSRRSKYGRKVEFVSSCPIPGVLHACRASRSLALTRWRLSFAARYQEPKIFFDFGNDVLFFNEYYSSARRFGEYMSSMRNFADAVDFGDRQATEYLAFHLDDQWMKDYFTDGEDLSVVLHKDFPNIKLIVFVESDIDDMVEEASKQLRRSDRLAQLQPPKLLREPKNPIIRFVKPDPDSEIDNMTMEVMYDFREACNGAGLIAPCMVRVNYYTRDLSEYEYNEDERRLQSTLFTRYYAEMLEKRNKRPKYRPDSVVSDAKMQNESKSIESAVRMKS